MVVEARGKHPRLVRERAVDQDATGEAGDGRVAMLLLVTVARRRALGGDVALLVSRHLLPVHHVTAPGVFDGHVDGLVRTPSNLQAIVKRKYPVASYYSTFPLASLTTWA